MSVLKGVGVFGDVGVAFFLQDLGHLDEEGGGVEGRTLAGLIWEREKNELSLIS